MTAASTKRSSRGSAPGITIVSRSAAALASDAVWMSNGRLVSHSIVEPRFKRALLQYMAALRRDPQALKDYYVRMGVLTKGGKLSSRYGG